MATVTPPPVGTPVVSPATLNMVIVWQDWMRTLVQAVNDLQTQLADITPTLVPWTPQLVGTTGGSAHTYTTQWGAAIHSGRNWTVAATIALAAVDPTMGGTVRIHGLPATIVAPPEAFFPVTVGFSGVSLGGQYTGVFGAIVTGEPAVRLYQQGNNAGWELLPASGMTASTQLACSASYWSG